MESIVHDNAEDMLMELEPSEVQLVQWTRPTLHLEDCNKFKWQPLPSDDCCINGKWQLDSQIQGLFFILTLF